MHFQAILVVLASALIVHVTSRTWRPTTAPWSRTSATTACTTPVCASCPPGYRTVMIHDFGCYYRCVCERISTTAMPVTSPTPSTKDPARKLILLDLLKNIESNAASIENMAQGLSAELALAEQMAQNLLN